MDFAAYDFGESGDNDKGDHSSQNQQHSVDGGVDFFSFAHVSADYPAANDPASMTMDYAQDLGSSFPMTQFTNQDAHNVMLQGHMGATRYDMASPAHTPVSRPHGGIGSMFGEDEEFFSPLLSPAIAPPFQPPHHPHTNTAESTFSPLTSPALHSQPPVVENVLQQRLAMIEKQQQQLRSVHPHLQPSVKEPQQLAPSVAATATTTTTTTGITGYAGGAASRSSGVDGDGGFIAPATPSLLMKLGQGNKSSSSSRNHTPTHSPQAAPPPPSTSVDNMGSLPAAMLEMKPSTAPSKRQIKRRRVSRVSAAFTSPAGLAPMHMMSPRMPGTDPTIAALVSPAALRPQPSSTASPRALKPLISPSLQPNGKRLTAMEQEVAAAALATKSNYQNMREGKARSLGIEFSTSFQSGVENRRSAHKAAEQKRRDTLKQSFDALRKEIADALLEQQRTDPADGRPPPPEDAGDDDQRRENKEKEVRQMSKVVLIQHSYEYILRLKEENRRKDQEMARLKSELDSLHKQLHPQ